MVILILTIDYIPFRYCEKNVKKRTYVLIHVLNRYIVQIRRPQQDLHILYDRKTIKNELHCGRWPQTHFPIPKTTGKCFYFRQNFKKKIHVPKYAVLCGDKYTPGRCLMPLAK